MAPARLVIWLATALVAWLVVHELHVLIPGLQDFGGPVFGRWVHVVVMALGAVAVLARAVVHRRERLGWALLGCGLLAWTAGEAYFTHVLWDLASPPVPSPADVGYLLFPILSLAGIIALACARVRGADRMMAADAATAALAAGAVSAALVFGAVLDVVGGERLALATNLAYPVGDLLLLATIVGVGGLQGWRVNRTWVALAAGCLLFTFTDGVYLVQVAKGTWVSGGPFDAGWWAAAPIWALAAWMPARAERARARETAGGARLSLPLGFASIALAVLVAAAHWEVNVLAVGLAAAALVASIARLHLTLRAHAASLRHAQGEALTDPLTALGNRRRLASDLDERLSTLDDGGELMLVVFDLDGFKHYNDVFGHPAGDAALVRLAARLREAVGPAGSAYRLGGDEFCALLAPAAHGWESQLDECVAALSEEGEGYAIGCSHGAILLPHDAADAMDAMRLADQRMYARKQDGRLSALRQATDALMCAMAERFPELGEHTAQVAGLAAATACSLGMNQEEVEEVRRAAELHDIGKVAIPEVILEKRGPLDPAEWWHIRRHTVIGERIVASAPALGRVARIVRSTHERHAGGGYPDGLAGQEIPLGARIVAVCDAFDAMTRTRPHRSAMAPELALAELQACAGEQFDPEVVAAFVRAWRETAPAGAPPEAAAA
jgi:diguanylate cyclase (GGDEF)-like protein/putative nucleotidyltransferase with HDIG domain